MNRLLPALLLAACTSLAQAATLEVTLVHPTADADGNPIPASGQGALISSRVEYGTCTPAGEFGNVLGARSTPMPATVVTFPNVPIAILCVRAFWANAFGESPASPVVTTGAAPAAGSIVTVKVSP